MPPDGFGPDSKWCAFVTWLWNRYADRLAAFEVVNEPNGQLWPQRSTGKATTSTSSGVPKARNC